MCRRAKVCSIRFIDPLRSNSSDPVKGRIATRVEVMSYGSMSFPDAANKASFQLNGIVLGRSVWSRSRHFWSAVQAIALNPCH